MEVRIVWINLARSTERARWMRAHLEGRGIVAERFGAVDGRAPLPESVVEHHRRYRTGLTATATPTEGCALSHLGVLEQASRHQGWTVVLEDDARLSRDFETMLPLVRGEAPADTALVWLHRSSGVVGRGRWRTLVRRVTEWGDPRARKRAGRMKHSLVPPWWWCGGTWGYAVHATGARRLLDALERTKVLDDVKHIDVALRRLGKELPIYGATSVLVERSPLWRESPHWDRRLALEPWPLVDDWVEQELARLAFRVHRGRRRRAEKAHPARYGVPDHPSTKIGTSRSGRPPRALVTYNDTNASAFELTRVLRAEGFEVHHLRLTGHQPVLQDRAYQARAVDAVERRIAAARIDVLLPVFEECFFLSQHRDRLRCRTLLAAHSTYLELHDKREAARFNRRHGLPHVPTIILRDGESTAPLDGARRVYLKEADSRGGWGTQVFSRAADALEHLSTCGAPASEYVLQAHLPGSLWIVQGVFVSGSLVDHEILRKVSVWSDEGTVRYIPYHVGDDDDGEALELLATVGRLASYEGMLEFECLGEPGALRILEYNPRFSADFIHSVHTASSFATNTVRAYAGLPAIPHRPGVGLTRNESIWRRYLPRQASTAPGALLDPRWPLRWLAMEARAGWSRRRSPYREYSERPASLTTLVHP